MFYLSDAAIREWYEFMQVDTLEQRGGRQCPKHFDRCFSRNPADVELRSYPFTASLSELFGSRETMLDVHSIPCKTYHNQHLYYTLRQTYGDIQPLMEARGHRFLRCEVADRTTFLQLALIGRWTFWMTCSTRHVIIEGQGDERIVVSTDSSYTAESLEKLFSGG
jgi:hypothetical protein